MNLPKIAYRESFGNKKFIRSLVAALFWLAAGLTATYWTVVYATNISSNAVTDIILSNLPPLNVDGVFIYGPLLFWAIIIIYLHNKPKRWPFVLKSLGWFLIVRSVFVSLTHIGPFPDREIISSDGVLGIFSGGHDLFFSGHTGLPFLMALIFWDEKSWRYFCLGASLFFGAVVLLGHFHYSIDVLGAYFITFTIFEQAKRMFKQSD